MLSKVKLHGKLAEFIGHKEFDVKVNSVAQAVSFLIHNFPEAEVHMNPQYYMIQVGDEIMSKEELHYPVGQQEINFIPVIAGKGNIGKVVLGGALIAMSFGVGGLFTSPLAFGGGGIGLASAGLGAKAAFGIGAAMVLGGVSGMLFPVPDQQQFSSEEDPRISFSFGGVQNTSRAGTPVPIVYGEIITGSVVISAALDTNQVVA
tara:strand:- start:38 stop:649 length:612 start_codon:yes stop_codon:yes gene_type:complete